MEDLAERGLGVLILDCNVLTRLTHVGHKEFAGFSSIVGQE
jgi:hypothetical protein